MTSSNGGVALLYAYAGRRHAAFYFLYDCHIPLLKCYYGMR